MTLSSSNTLYWNTNRTYTNKGQRIAALAIGGGVWMVDVDRGLDYFFPDCELDRYQIMQRYDGYVNATSAFKLVQEDYYPIRTQLETVASAQSLPQ
jgi:hypothetical protein